MSEVCCNNNNKPWLKCMENNLKFWEERKKEFESSSEKAGGKDERV